MSNGSSGQLSGKFKHISVLRWRPQGRGVIPIGLKHHGQDEINHER